MNAQPVLLLLSFFGFVMAATLAAGYYLVLRPSTRRAATQGAGGAGVRLALESLGEALPRKASPRGTVTKLLSYAGYRSPSAIQAFEGVRIVSAVAVAAVFSVFGARLFPGAGSVLGAVLAGGMFGYLIPERVLDLLISRRSSRLRAGLPSALDIWALGIEAGHPLESAIADSCRELHRVFPDLCAEFSTFQVELRAGKGRYAILNDIAARNREPELRKVCKLLSDGDRFGVSLAPALRNHARYLRIRSRQKAQEAARKVSVKLVFPVFFLIFPAVVLITLGPAVIRVANLFQSLMELK